jgi:hypothetical protein
MKIRITMFSCIALFLFNVFGIYANGTTENPNEISDYFKNLIETGEMKPLFLLETLEKEKYEIVMEYLPEGEKIEDYYYEISICIIIDEKTKQYFTLEKYNLIKNLPEYKDKEIETIDYAIWYYEAFFNKYNGSAGNTTGKCFSIIFNGRNEFIGKFLWK